MCTLKVLDEKMGVLVVNPPTSPPKHVGSDAILERGTEACLIEVYQKGPLVIKVWGAKSQKTLWGLWKGEGPSD